MGSGRQKMGTNFPMGRTPVTNGVTHPFEWSKKRRVWLLLGSMRRFWNMNNTNHATTLGVGKVPNNATDATLYRTTNCLVPFFSCSHLHGGNTKRDDAAYFESFDWGVFSREDMDYSHHPTEPNDVRTLWSYESTTLLASQ